MRRFALAVLASVAVATTAHADPPTGSLIGIDLMSATVLQEGQSSFAGLGIRARLHPDRLISGIEVLPSIEYWRNSSTVSPYDIRATRKDATLGLDARYNFQIHGWNPYVGAGFGIHFLSSRINAPTLGLNDASNSVIKGGLAALVGTTFPLTKRVDDFIELKYHHVPDYRQLKINWGLAIKF